jgi:hypothetical protein
MMGYIMMRYAGANGILLVTRYSLLVTRYSLLVTPPNTPHSSLAGISCLLGDVLHAVVVGEGSGGGAEVRVVAEAVAAQG